MSKKKNTKPRLLIDDVKTHYGYTFGDVHFAIHPPDAGWTGVPTRNYSPEHW